MRLQRLLFIICGFLLVANTFAQSADLVPFQDENGKWGYKNGNGEIAIEPLFACAEPFSEGIAVVKSGDKYGMIDQYGKFVVEPIYEFGIAYHNGYYILNHEILDLKGNRITAKNGDFEGRSYFDHISLLEESDLAIVDPYGIGKGRYLMRLDGQIIGKYDYGFYDFKEGLCLIANRHGKKEYVEGYLSWISLYGYIDTSGKVVIKPTFRDARSFSEGLAVAQNNKYKRGYIDKKGKWAIKPQFSAAYDFHNGLAFVEKDGFSGFIDKEGNQRLLITEDEFCFFLTKIDKEADVVDPVNVKWLRNDSIKITYWLHPDRNPKTIQRTAIIDIEGKVLRFDDGGKVKVDRNGKHIENQKNQKPSIDWPIIPSSTTQQLFALKAQIKSDSKIAYCTVYLNGSPIAEDFAPSGSHVANDIKETDNYNFTISKTLALKDGKNTIRIKVGNAGGVTDESREITYTPIKQSVAKPAITMGVIPDKTTSSKLVVTAEVTSESAIASCDLYLERNCDGTKGSHIAPDIIEGQEKGKLSKTMNRTFTLCEGENNIVAEATNAAGMTKVVKKVIYEKPEPPAIAWDGIVPENTTKSTLEVKATIASKTDVTWRIMKSSSGKTKGSNVAADIIENVVASGKGNNVNGQVTLSPRYNTITIEATNAYERKTVSKKVWHSPCEKRIALVIGNANYRRVENLGRFGKLQNPINDAISIYKELESCGFDMMPIVKNANLKTMQESINAFIDKANKEHYEVAFIYYSGHGVSPSIEKREKQESFFIPLIEEDSIAYIEDLAKYAIDANRLIEDLNNKTDCRIKIAMLDCCRSCNLASRAKGPMALKGMNPLNVPFGEQIFFAARYKEAALDYINRDDTNSPFVTAFLQCFREYPNYKWEDLVKKVILKVHELTGTYQEPKAEGTLKGDFYLNPYHDKP